MFLDCYLTILRTSTDKRGILIPAFLGHMSDMDVFLCNLYTTARISLGISKHEARTYFGGSNFDKICIAFQRWWTMWGTIRTIFTSTYLIGMVKTNQDIIDFTILKLTSPFDMCRHGMFLFLQARVSLITYTSKGFSHFFLCLLVSSWREFENGCVVSTSIHPITNTYKCLRYCFRELCIYYLFIRIHLYTYAYTHSEFIKSLMNNII